MSVINNVLKDLETRPSSFTPLRLKTAGEQKRSLQQNPQLRWLVVLILMLFVAAWFLSKQIVGQETAMKPDTQADTLAGVDASQVVEATIPVQAPQDVMVEAVPDEVAHPAERQIIGLQINETPVFMELTFHLSDRGQSFLKQRGENRYVFTLVDTQSQIDAPMIQQNPWLQEMDIERRDQQVDIRFITLPGVLVETRQQQIEDEYFWLVRLKKTLSRTASQSQPKATRSDPFKPVTREEKTASKEPAETMQSRPAVDEQQAIPAASDTVRLQIKPVQTQVSASERLQLALQAMQTGDLNAAQGELQGLLGSPLDREARLHLLNLWQQQLKLTDYRQLLMQSVAIYPADEDFAMMDAAILFSGEQFLPLIQRYQGFEQSAKLQALVAAAYQRLQQHDKASEFFVRSLALDSQQPKNWISLAISQEQLSQSAEALNSYQMARRSGPVNQRLDEFIRQRIDTLGKVVQ